MSSLVQDMTEKYPDILALVPLMLSRPSRPDLTDGEVPWPPEHVESFILDAEVSRFILLFLGCSFAQF